jgi:cell division protease FtsH
MKREPQIDLPIKKPAKVDQPEPRWRWTIIYFLLTMLILWGWQDLFYQLSVRTIPYSQFKTYLARHEVVTAVVKQDEIDGRIVPKNQSPEPSPTTSPPSENQKSESSPSAALNHEGQRTAAQTQPFLFRTERVEDPDLVRQLQAANVEFAAARPGIISQLLVGWILPIIFMVAIWTFLARRLNPTGGSIFSIGKSRARLVADPDTGVKFEDVAGCDEAKFELKEVVDFLKNPKQYEDLGARIPKGVLLVGPPGTGKTLLARAVAGEAKVPFFSISGSDFVEMFVGVGAARVRDLFKQAKEHAPCIIFIDELDAIGRQRGVHVGAVNDEREQTLNALLVEMDGFEANVGVIILAATNRPEVLDRALLRPGRFDRQVVVDAPDLDGREAILKVHVAYHEVGHALIAAYSLHADPVHKISIVPRGRGALGYTMQLPSEDQFLMTRSELVDRIRGLLGGRAAEEIVFAEVSTGAQNDLERATALARQMVALYGMSERVGLANCVRRQPMFLNGQESELQRDCSEETAREIDEEVKKLLDLAYGEARETLSAHRDQLEHVAAELLKSESIDGPTFYRLVGREVPAFEESRNIAAVATQPKERVGPSTG